MADRPHHCKATTDHTGDYVCHRCGLQWDADDTDPPECRRESGKASEAVHLRELGRIKNILPDEGAK